MHNRREYKNKIFVGITWWKIKKNHYDFDGSNKSFKLENSKDCIK